MSEDSDHDQDAVKSDEAATDEAATDEAADDAAPTPTPSPRPRSAASRARRIGGAAATPRPDTDAAKNAGAGSTSKAGTSTVDTAKQTRKRGAGKADTTTKPTGKATGTGAKSTPVSTSKAGKPGRSTADGDAGDAKAASLTLSVPGWARWVPGFAFAATAVVFLVLFAVSRIGGDDAPSSTSPKMRQEVLAAAKTCLATLNTYRYDQIPQAETAGAKCTTGKLTTDYKKTVTTVISKNAPPLKAVQVAKINTAGIEAVTKDGKQWTILAYGQLNITTANTAKQGRIDPFAVIARLEQVKGEWVLAKVDTVSSFSR